MTNIEYCETQIKQYSEQLEKERRIENIKTVAQKTHEIYQAFLDAGFDEGQAWWVAGTMLQKAIDSVCDGTKTITL